MTEPNAEVGAVHRKAGGLALRSWEIAVTICAGAMKKAIARERLGAFRKHAPIRRP
jgi:hypothetical protein